MNESVNYWRRSVKHVSSSPATCAALAWHGLALSSTRRSTVSPAKAEMQGQSGLEATLADGAVASRFVDDLIHKMTLEEKIGQMSQVALNTPDKEFRDELPLKGEVGSFLFITDPKEINRLQHLAVEKGRLHIPLIFGFDVIHGFRTIYPVPLALAAE